MLTPDQLKGYLQKYTFLKSASALKTAGVNYSSFQRWYDGRASVHYWKYFDAYAEWVQSIVQVIEQFNTKQNG